MMKAVAGIQALVMVVPSLALAQRVPVQKKQAQPIQVQTVCFERSGPYGLEKWCREGDGQPYRAGVVEAGREPGARATATATAAPVAYRPRDGYLNPEAAAYIASGSRKHSWAGPFRVGAIFSAAASGALFSASSEETPLTGAALSTLGFSVVFFLVATVLDASAEQDFTQAAGTSD